MIFFFLGIPILLVCIILLFIRLTLVVVTVECQSMSPSLEHGDRVLVWRNFPTRWLHKGQIAVVWPYAHLRGNGTEPFGVQQPFIKRIVGLPDETITTSINELGEMIRDHHRADYDERGQRTWHVPAGHVFVQGDRHGAVVDSRIWGPIPIEGVLGVMILQLPDRPLEETVWSPSEDETLPPEVRSYLENHTDPA